MLTHYLLNFLLFLLPTQLGLHFWPEQARVSGLKIDYLSPTLYLSQLVIFCLILLNLGQTIKTVKKHKVIFIYFVLLSSINTFTSSSPLITSYRWLEVYALIFLGSVIYKNKKYIVKNLKFFYLGIVTVIALQVLQVLLQSSIQGPFYWLGERKFDFYTPSLPKVSFGNTSLLRVPSTFSHANSLAGFVLLSFYFIKNFKPQNSFLKLISLMSLVLTFSKNSLLTLLVLSCFNLKTKLILLLCLFTTSLLIFLPRENSMPYFVSSRVEGYQYSIEIFKQNALFGTGLGAYIASLGESLPASKVDLTNLQPVHNIYLLLVSELGLLGVVLLLLVLIKSNIRSNYNIFLNVVLITGLFDHYWLTQIQNKLLLVVCLCLFGVKYSHDKISKSPSKYWWWFKR